jgi:hypothetical protein
LFAQEFQTLEAGGLFGFQMGEIGQHPDDAGFDGDFRAPLWQSAGNPEPSKFLF